jgi:hypothetical protein
MAATKKGNAMTGAQYQKAINRLHLSQMDSARMLAVNGRTVRRWIADQVPIPHSVAIVIKLMIDRDIAPEEIVQLFKRKKKIETGASAPAS